MFLKDTSAADLNAVIEFIYKGSVNVAQTQLASFIKTAEMLQIRGLSGEDDKVGLLIYFLTPPPLFHTVALSLSWKSWKHDICLIWILYKRHFSNHRRTCALGPAVLNKLWASMAADHSARVSMKTGVKPETVCPLTHRMHSHLPEVSFSSCKATGVVRERTPRRMHIEGVRLCNITDFSITFIPET